MMGTENTEICESRKELFASAKAFLPLTYMTSLSGSILLAIVLLTGRWF